MTALGKRLARLEAQAAPDPNRPVFTREERFFALFYIASAAAKFDDASSAEWAKRAERQKQMILAKAKVQATDQFRHHLTGWVHDMWAASGQTSPFLPPIIGETSDDWTTPRLYHRRLYIRCQRPIMELIGPPELEWDEIYRLQRFDIFEAFREEGRLIGKPPRDAG